MKLDTIVKFVCGATASAIALLTALIVQADGWDNFKLKHFYLTSLVHAQNQENVLPKQINADASRINLTELLNGGPPKDGIPSIDNPKFDTSQTTPFGQDELVIGVVVNGEAKVYPLGILNWHELVNDRLGGVNVSVSYCPLCDTVVAFERQNTTFGVSGKLYQSCLVMYDRDDDTLYSQPWAMGVVGPQVNRSLKTIPAVKTTLGAWLAQYPQSQVLSTDTGYSRDYQRYPYGSYYTDATLVFPVRHQDKLALHPKAIVSYIWEADGKTPHNHFSGATLQFPHDELQQAGEKVVGFNGRTIKARWDGDLETVVVEEMDGTVIASSTAFAFVYPAYFD